MTDMLDSMDVNIKLIQNLIPEAARYEQLAEECSELAQACLKKARKIRNENYTPMSMDEIDSNIEEEYTDVQLAAIACGLAVNWHVAHNKVNRWISRNNNKNYITMDSITDMLFRLGYDPEHLTIKSVGKDFKKLPCQIKGIAFFEDPNDTLPSIIIDIDHQKVCIFDKRHLDGISEKTGQNMLYIVFMFDSVLGTNVTWSSLIEGMTFSFDDTINR